MASARVMEMLSEHTLEGWFEGYVLTGRHGFFSMKLHPHQTHPANGWRMQTELDCEPVPRHCLITSLVWRQDHDGFTHRIRDL